MSTQSNTDNTSSSSITMHTGVFMDTGLSMLRDPSSNLVPLGDEIPSDTGIQETLRAVHEEAGNAAVRARLGLGVARAEAELRDLPHADDSAAACNL